MGSQQIPRTGAQAVERAAQVLGCFAEHERLGVSAVAQMLDLSAPTAHRMMRALAQAGLLAQHADRTYALGIVTATLGRVASARSGVDEAEQVMTEIAMTTGETVVLGVRIGDRSLVALSVAGWRDEVSPDHTGSFNPYHGCALGKVLVAFGEGPRPDGELVALTSHTIVAPEALDGELRAVVERGFAVNDQELEMGYRGVGVPIFSSRGGHRVVAALAIGAPVSRLHTREFEALADTLSPAARRLDGVVAVG